MMSRRALAVLTAAALSGGFALAAPNWRLLRKVA